MVNINKIKIIHFNLDLSGYIPFEFIHYYNELNNFGVALVIDSKELRHELNFCDGHTVYDITNYEKLNKIFDIIDITKFCGISLSIDGILDAMLDDEDVGKLRRSYLDSMLYYKTTQEGKPINNFFLTLKHIDTLLEEHPEDIFDFYIVNQNYNLTETKVDLRSYLTKEEVKNKFKKYIITIN